MNVSRKIYRPSRRRLTVKSKTLIGTVIPRYAHIRAVMLLRASAYAAAITSRVRADFGSSGSSGGRSFGVRRVTVVSSTARASASLARPGAADRLERTRASPSRPISLSSVAGQVPCDRHPQPVSPADREVSIKPPRGRTRKDFVCVGGRKPASGRGTAAVPGTAVSNPKTGQQAHEPLIGSNIVAELPLAGLSLASTRHRL